MAEKFKQAQTLEAEAKSLVANQQYSEAELKYKSAIALQPYSHSLRITVGAFYELWNRPEKAYEQYRLVALSKLPGEANGAGTKSYSSFQHEPWLYLKCAEFASTHGNPNDELAFLKRGWATSKRNIGGFAPIPEPLDSVKSYRQALMLRSAMNTSVQSGDSAALAQFTAAAELDPDNAAAWVLVAQSARTLGKYDLALKCLDKARVAKRRSEEIDTFISDEMRDLNPRG